MYESINPYREENAYSLLYEPNSFTDSISSQAPHHVLLETRSFYSIKTLHGLEIVHGFLSPKLKSILDTKIKETETKNSFFLKSKATICKK